MSDRPQKLSKFHKKIDIPNPERQIGTTRDGKPVWLDIRELIATPEEKAERQQKTVENRITATVDTAAKLVLKNAALFIEQTFWNIADDTGKRLYADGNAKGAFDYAVQNGVETIQDGLKTIIKVRGKIIREMTAKVAEPWRDRIAQRVNELVKKLPTGVKA